MYTLYIYNGHFEKDVFLRDSIYKKLYFDKVRDIRDYLSLNKMDLNNFDYLIESPNGDFNSIYRYNF